ncbi:MAG: GAF domain-containing sensor histidine kinase [Gaiellales bacterium]
MSENGLRSVTDVLLAVAAEPSTGRRLHMLVDAARDAVAATYGAIGVPDGEGGFARFVTSGMSEDEIARIGPLPRTHGLLAAMLESAAPERMADIRHDPRYRWWPSAHPVMTSFLGVPIVAGGEIVGAFYLVNKDGGGEFSQDDEDAIRLLAAHAAIAIEHAAAGERSRELSVVEERNRLARELHDSVNQTLWGAVLTAEAATELMASDPAGAAVEVGRVRDLAGSALEQLRSLVFELRPAEVATDGLAGALQKHVDVLRQVHDAAIRYTPPPEPVLRAGAKRQVLRIAQEALANAVRHAGAAAVDVRLSDHDDVIELEVADDGIGFDPDAKALRGRHLGLTSMAERAALLDAELDVRSQLGSGTTVSLRVPAARHRPRGGEDA